ncbi:hypothetical protein PBY51_013890 [Eleginops maclovinus]|uniref:Uncharacterized protein n=1 Tax=Eleginops maclovinus TaxID=56733 RepID=A0AAN7WWB0_ELEMC|nr:hypothetical protein PBY51_013890 [Eleginops maclovinus]
MSRSRVHISVQTEAASCCIPQIIIMFKHHHLLRHCCSSNEEKEKEKKRLSVRNAAPKKKVPLGCEGPTKSAKMQE